MVPGARRRDSKCIRKRVTTVLLERQSRFGTVPIHEFVSRMPVAALSVGARKTVENRGLCGLKVRQPQDRLGSTEPPPAAGFLLHDPWPPIDRFRMSSVRPILPRPPRIKRKRKYLTQFPQTEADSLIAPAEKPALGFGDVFS
jgi:hypothetical protein